MYFPEKDKQMIKDDPFWIVFFVPGIRLNLQPCQQLVNIILFDIPVMGTNTFFSSRNVFVGNRVHNFTVFRQRAVCQGGIIQDGSHETRLLAGKLFVHVFQTAVARILNQQFMKLLIPASTLK